MFIILTIMATVCLIYCTDAPVVHNSFSFLINNHDSVMYGIGMSIIAAYIFYVIQIALPTYINQKKEWKVIWRILKDISEDMWRIMEIIYPISVDDDISKEEVLNKLTKIDFYKTGSNEYFMGKEASKIEALYRIQYKIHKKIMEIFSYKYVNDKILNILGKLDKSLFFKLVIDLYEMPPGDLELLNPINKLWPSGFRIVNMECYNFDLANGYMEYVDLYKSIIKLTEKY